MHLWSWVADWELGSNEIKKVPTSKGMSMLVAM